MIVEKNEVKDEVKDEKVFIEEELYQEIKTKLNKNNDYFSEKEIKRYIKNWFDFLIKLFYNLYIFKIVCQIVCQNNYYTDENIRKSELYKNRLNRS